MTGFLVLKRKLPTLSVYIIADTRTRTLAVGIDIHSNRMEGAMPTEFGRLTKLRKFYDLILFSNNIFANFLTPKKNNCIPYTEVLSLDITLMGGLFPAELGAMTSLETLRITTPSSVKQPFPLSVTQLTKLGTFLWHICSQTACTLSLSHTLILS